MEKWEYEFQPLPSPEGDRTAPLVIVPREEWGARPPKSTVPVQHPVRKVVYTFSIRGTPCDSKAECMRFVKRLQSEHMDEMGMSDIAYNFLVGSDGAIYEGRGWHAKSSKLLKYNPKWYDKRIDIAFIGDFSTSMIPPLDMLEGAVNLGQLGIDKGYLKDPYRVHDIRNWKEMMREAKQKKLPPAKKQEPVMKQEEPVVNQENPT